MVYKLLMAGEPIAIIAGGGVVRRTGRRFERPPDHAGGIKGLSAEPDFPASLARTGPDRRTVEDCGEAGSCL